MAIKNSAATQPGQDMQQTSNDVMIAVGSLCLNHSNSISILRVIPNLNNQTLAEE